MQVGNKQHLTLHNKPLIKENNIRNIKYVRPIKSHWNRITLHYTTLTLGSTPPLQEQRKPSIISILPPTSLTAMMPGCAQNAAPKKPWLLRRCTMVHAAFHSETVMRDETYHCSTLHFSGNGGSSCNGTPRRLPITQHESSAWNILEWFKTARYSAHGVQEASVNCFCQGTIMRKDGHVWVLLRKKNGHGSALATHGTRVIHHGNHPVVA